MGINSYKKRNRGEKLHFYYLFYKNNEYLKLSNNNGNTWESYSGTETTEHNFTSTGNQLLCKVQGDGTVAKNAYKMSGSKDSITFGTKHAMAMNPSIKGGITNFKLKGKKI